MTPKTSRPVLGLASRAAAATSPCMTSVAAPRRYATTSAPSGAACGNHHDWPKSRKPSPYEIFGQHRHAPYSKAKFYELVKIYHPDTQHQGPPDSHMSHTMRLERYRLIVAANNILCDPVRRQSYDRFGLGWDGAAGNDSTRTGSTTNRSWREEPGNASMNATWEDWERWYAERDGRAGGGTYAKQQPVYMPNGMFVFVLCLLVMVGSVGQARRASTSTMHIVEMREQNHMAINEGIRKRQTDQVMLNRHERVEHFLRSREGWRLSEAELRAHAQRKHEHELDHDDEPPAGSGKTK
ncbi:DnaJ domain-containing protein [Microdochium nivale]|nr:DnaJ domain-containing protein [Microdochium nivale]